MQTSRLLPAYALPLLAIIFVGGCTTVASPSLPNRPVIKEVPVEPATFPPKSEYVPVVRYGRYTLVELAPTAAQHDLLLQTVDVAMPDQAQASVGDGLRHVLRRTGYRLCVADTTRALDALPLPAAHLHLGPLTLRDALLTLTGAAWVMRVDEAGRRICFAPAGVPAGTVPVGVGQTLAPVDAEPAKVYPVSEQGEQP